jgi:hypothetical protein
VDVLEKVGAVAGFTFKPFGSLLPVGTLLEIELDIEKEALNPEWITPGEFGEFNGCCAG